MNNQIDNKEDIFETLLNEAKEKINETNSLLEKQKNESEKNQNEAIEISSNKKNKKIMLAGIGIIAIIGGYFYFSRR